MKIHDVTEMIQTTRERGPPLQPEPDRQPAYTHPCMYPTATKDREAPS